MKEIQIVNKRETQTVNGCGENKQFKVKKVLEIGSGQYNLKMNWQIKEENIKRTTIN